MFPKRLAFYMLNESFFTVLITRFQTHFFVLQCTWVTKYATFFEDKITPGKPVPDQHINTRLEVCTVVQSCVVSYYLPLRLLVSPPCKGFGALTDGR